MRRLIVLKGFTPNSEDGTYYGLTRTAFISYIRNLPSNIIVKELTPDNYRIDTETLRLAYDEDLKLMDMATITYVIDYETADPETYYRAYYVNNFFVQSSNVIFNLTVDLWGSYIGSALFKHSHIIKCNRNIGKGFYDPIERTEGSNDFLTPSSYVGEQPEINDENVGIVFLLKYNISENVGGSEYVTRSELFYMGLHYWKTVLMSRDPVISGLDNKHLCSLDIALDMIGGIYGVKSTVSGAGWLTNGAEVVKAYVVDKRYIKLDDNGTRYGIVARSKGTYFMGEIEIPITHVYPMVYEKLYYVPNYDINYEYYAGELLQGLKLLRTTTSNLEYYLTVVTTASSMQFLLNVGNEQRDITEAFETDITLNSAVQTGWRKAIEFIGRAVPAVINSLKDYSKGDYASIASRGATSLASVVAQHSSLGNMIGKGDGYINFWRSQYPEDDTFLLKNPAKLLRVKSAYDEEVNARRKGANFDVWLDNLNIFSYVRNYALLGNVSDTFDDTYIKCDSIDVNNVPKEAGNYIASLLLRGVYVKLN